MTAPDNPVPLKSVKPEEWPERLYGWKAVVRFPSGVESGNWYSKPDAGGDQTREYIRADVARADAELAVAEAIRRAADLIVSSAYTSNGDRRSLEPVAESLRGADQHHATIAAAILSLAHADALAEAQRLWARVTSLSEQVDTIAEQRDASDAEVQRLREERDAIADRHARALLAGAEVRAERDAALARVERLRAERDALQKCCLRGMDMTNHHNAAMCPYCSAEESKAREKLMDTVRAAEAERDAALARVEKLRHQMTEASDPDFLFGAMDNVNDMDVTLDQFAAAASWAIRTALDEDAK